ncbi:membrane protein [Spirochaetia bacterium]|nr:membrane protein [Spirochaetia bacterium]
MVNILYTVVIYPITQIIEFVFVVSQKIFKETGISVIAISAVISILCLPLYAVAEKWQQRERDTQKRLAPGIAKIKAVFKGDEQYMILSTFYRQNHYHPVYALRSTFGLLIQIPFFIAAYSYLSNLEALKGASFLFIHDMGAPDKLAHTASFSFNILPVAMTIINIAAGAVYLRGFPIKDKVQLYGMALIFLLLLYNSPAGLVLYWTLNNVFSFFKNLYYKISLKSKNLLLRAVITFFCLLFSIYIFISYTNMRGRTLALLSAVIGAFPWIWSLLRKWSKKLPKMAHTSKEICTGFLVSFAVLWVLTGFFVPSLLIAASPQEFSFIDNYTTPLYFIFNTASQAFGFFIFWPVCLYLLFSDSTKTGFYFAGIVLCAAALCNVFLFSGGYGIISVDLVFANGRPTHNFTEIAGNIAALLVLACLVTILASAKLKKLLIITLSCALFALAGITAVNLFSIAREYRRMSEYYTKPDPQTSVNSLFRMSKTGINVVIIMLDRAISTYVPYIMEESPELREKFSGFSYYPNTVSFAGYTSPGATPIFGGYEATPEEMNKKDTIPVAEKHDQALLMLPRIFSENQYEVTVTDPPYAGYNQVSDLSIYDSLQNVHATITDSVYTDLWIDEHGLNLPSQSAVLKRNILWYSFFKIFPLAFREGLYAFGNWCAPVEGHSLRLTLNGYAVLDYLPKLTEISETKQNTLLLMVNNTTHEGSLFQTPEYRPQLPLTNTGAGPFKNNESYHTNAASLKRLADWFDLLKAEGLYDNTRIILVSDHGPERNYVLKIDLPFNVEQFNAFLMVKDFNASGSLQTDMAFMSNADVPVIALRGLVENPVNPYSGNKITDESKKHPLYIALSESMQLGDATGTQIMLNHKKNYYVHDNIFNPANWEKVEK